MMQISEAEAVVMEVLWGQAPRSAEEVVAALASRDWAEPTIKTLLNRLLTKGAIAAERDGRRYLYRPLLQRQAWVQAQSEDFLGRVFEGRVAPLVAHFSQRGQLSAQDIAELKRLIQELGDE
ncbi:MAG: Penicillinase repressor [Stenotrophomonas maltophilia]|uniref:Penicillinase repressor n=1 Tax=Stenotrophomonas maltophilia TaxID=40324 RepID=A0A7V8FFH4_STEMA|nr:MAG: Penicillinase repressor [Stenotrophomonas maltophilia]